MADEIKKIITVDIQNAEQSLSNLAKATKKAKEETQAAEGSYKALSKELSSLKKQWKETGDEAERSRLGKQINSVNDKLKEMDKTVGVYSRNVGNYQSALNGAFSKLSTNIGSSIPLAGNLVQSLMKIGGPGVVAAIAAVGGVISVVKKAISEASDEIKNSEQYIDKNKVALSGWEVAWRNIKQGFGGWITAFNDVKLAIADGTTKLLEFIGLLDEADVANQRSLNSMNVSLRNRERGLKITESETRARVAEYRAIASSEEETTEVRLANLKKAEQEEKNLAKIRITYAEDYLNYLIEVAKLDPNSSADNDAIVNAQVALNNAKATLDDITRQYNRYEKSIKNAGKTAANTHSNTKKQIDYVALAQEKLDKMTQETIDNFINDSYDVESVLEDLIKDLDRIEKETNEIIDINSSWERLSYTPIQKELSNLKDSYIKDYNKLVEYGASTVELTKNYEAERARIIEEYRNKQSEAEQQEIDDAKAKNEERKAIILSQVQMYSESVAAIGDIIGSISDFRQEQIEDELAAGKITEKEAKKQFENTKKAQIAASIIQGLSGVATAIAQAMQLGPIAGPIVGAVNAATVATTTGIQVAKIKKTQFGSNSNISSDATSATTNTTSLTNDTSSRLADSIGSTVVRETETSVRNIKVYVAADEITAAQNMNKVRVDEATF